MASKIEWTDGFQREGVTYTSQTWNPVTGCSKVSAGCANCYAKGIIDRYRGSCIRYRNGFDPTFHPDLLSVPTKWRKPRFVFVGSMSDVFHPAFDKHIHEILSVIEAHPQHVFVILTKRPKRMAHYLSGPRSKKLTNLIAGVSVENNAVLHRVEDLKLLPENICKVISAEPLLETLTHLPSLAGIDWVIAGSESGSRRRPSPRKAFRDLRDLCIDAGVPFYLKQIHEGRTKISMPLLDGQQWIQHPSY